MVVPRGDGGWRDHVIVLGVEGEHDDEATILLLDALLAWLMAARPMPLLVRSIKQDCLVAPPDRGGRHFEVRWIEL